MARKPDDPPADIPAWVMTFSDVITLLMTFFILLLTFATNEPESYGKSQASMFGGSGASGIVGDFTTQNDSVLMRARTRAGRATSRGSEMPPMKTAPVTKAMAKGIAGLETEEMRDLSSSHSIRLPWSSLLEGDKLTSSGEQQMRMLAFQIHRQQFSVQLSAANEQRLESALKIYEHLISTGQVKPFDMSVEKNNRVPADVLEIVISKQFTEE